MMPSWVPSYWKFHERPVRVLATDEGGADVALFDPETRSWQRQIGILADILFGHDPDVVELTQEDFERWIAALQEGRTEEDAWVAMVAQSSSLIEGLIEAIDGDALYVRGGWWKATGGLAPMVRVGDWVQLRPGTDGAAITEVRPGRR